MSLTISQDQQMHPAGAGVAAPRSIPQDNPASVACFEYTGRTALVLRGPYTGQRYWFQRPGARVTVDARDLHALLAVPVLRLIRS